MIQLTFQLTSQETTFEAMEFCLENKNNIYKAIRHIYANLYQGVAYSLTSIILQKVLFFKKSLFGKTVVLVHYVI